MILWKDFDFVFSRNKNDSPKKKAGQKTEEKIDDDSWWRQLFFLFVWSNKLGWLNHGRWLAGNTYCWKHNCSGVPVFNKKRDSSGLFFCSGSSTQLPETCFLGHPTFLIFESLLRGKLLTRETPSFPASSSRVLDLTKESRTPTAKHVILCRCGSQNWPFMSLSLSLSPSLFPLFFPLFCALTCFVFMFLRKMQAAKLQLRKIATTMN